MNLNKFRLPDPGHMAFKCIKLYAPAFGTMQTLDARHMELLLSEGYKDGSWEYNMIGSNDIKEHTEGVSGGIYDIKNLKDHSASEKLIAPPIESCSGKAGESCRVEITNQPPANEEDKGAEDNGGGEDDSGSDIDDVGGEENEGDEQDKNDGEEDDVEEDEDDEDDGEEDEDDEDEGEEEDNNNGEEVQRLTDNSSSSLEDVFEAEIALIVQQQEEEWAPMNIIEQTADRIERALLNVYSYNNDESINSPLTIHIIAETNLDCAPFFQRARQEGKNYIPQQVENAEKGLENILNQVKAYQGNVQDFEEPEIKEYLLPLLEEYIEMKQILKGEQICVLCQEKKAWVYMTPCGHYLFCQLCFEQNKGRFAEWDGIMCFFCGEWEDGFTLKKED